MSLFASSLVRLLSCLASHDIRIPDFSTLCPDPDEERGWAQVMRLSLATIRLCFSRAQRRDRQGGCLCNRDLYPPTDREQTLSRLLQPHPVKEAAQDDPQPMPVPEARSFGRGLGVPSQETVLVYNSVKRVKEPFRSQTCNKRVKINYLNWLLAVTQPNPLEGFGEERHL